MRKRNNKEKNTNSLFTDLDKDIKRENQVYVNEEILEAVLDAKKEAALTESKDSSEAAPTFTTVKKQRPADTKASIPENVPNTAPTDESESAANEPHPDDINIYDSLFSETTIVSTQIYTYDIDKQLGEDNFTSSCAYRVGQDTSGIGTIFTITKKDFDSPLNVSKPHSNNDLSWYNELAALGFSYAAICGTTVQGIVICEPQYWNNTLYIRHLMVEKKMRLKGIGRQLIEECEQRAKAEGFRAIVLEVQSLNGTAIDFYKSLGFNISGTNISLYSNSDILKEDVAIFMHKIIV